MKSSINIISAHLNLCFENHPPPKYLYICCTVYLKTRHQMVQNINAFSKHLLQDLFKSTCFLNLHISLLRINQSAENLLKICYKMHLPAFIALHGNHCLGSFLPVLIFGYKDWIFLILSR